MIRARRYVLGDARLIEVQPAQAVEARAIAANDSDLLTLQPGAVSYTMLRDDQPIACGGVVPLWDGFATAWGLAATMDLAAARAILRQIKRAIGEVKGLRRVEATARADFPGALGFLTALGFERVATLTAYGADGGDYVLFAWLAEGVRR